MNERRDDSQANAELDKGMLRASPAEMALASKLTDTDLGSITVDRRVELLTANQLMGQLANSVGDPFCESIEDGVSVHDELLEKLHSDMQAVYRDTGGREVLRAGVLTLWMFGLDMLLVDGRHRFQIAYQFFRNVPLPCVVVDLDHWKTEYLERLLVPHSVLANLVSRTLSDELRIVVLAQAVECLVKSHLRREVVPNHLSLVHELAPYWGDTLNESYMAALLRSIDWSWGIVLPRSLGGRGKPLTGVGPSTITPPIRGFLDGTIERVEKFPRVKSLRELQEWSHNPSKERVGTPAHPERLHFRTGYSYKESELKSLIIRLQAKGFPIASYYDLNNFADWAFVQALRLVETGELIYSPTSEFIGAGQSAWYKVKRANPCPECKDSFWVQYDSVHPTDEKLRCSNRRHFVHYPNGLRYAPTNEDDPTTPTSGPRNRDLPGGDSV